MQSVDFPVITYGDFSMPTNVPVTIWRPTNGNSEMGQSDSENITTISGLFFTALNGNELIVAPGSYTPKPATVWTQNDGE